MAVQTINTDIAAEVNITARRNDTFTFKFSVANPTNSSQGYPLNIGQTNTTTGEPRFQAKMSIVDASTGDVKLSIYSSFFQDTAGVVIHQDNGTGGQIKKTTRPTATTPGEYSGEQVLANTTVKTGGGIDFSGNTSAADSLATISVPYDYMVFEPGEYLYDLQIREQGTSGTNAAALLTIKYTTWMFGKFTLNPDITTA